MLQRTSHIRSLLIATTLLFLVACGGSGESVSAVSGSMIPGAGSNATGTATLNWLPPAENTDGSTVTNLAGYNIYRGTRNDSLVLAQTIRNPGITTAVLDGLAAGTHYFAVSAFLTSGVESEPSAVGSKTIP